MSLIKRWTAAWNDFWFAPTDGRGLTTFRVLFGLALLEYSIPLTPVLENLFSDNGFVPAERASRTWARSVLTWVSEPMAAPLTAVLMLGAMTWLIVGARRSSNNSEARDVRELALAAAIVLFLFAWLDDPWRVRLALAILWGASAAVCAGLHTRPAALIAYLVILWMRRRSPIPNADFEALLAFGSLVLCLAPAPKTHLPGADQEAQSASLVASWPTRLLSLQLTVIYPAAAWHKLAVGDWRRGTYLAELFSGDYCRWPMDAWLTDPKLLLLSRLMTWGVLAFEGMQAPLLWIHRTRRVAIVLGIAFHVGIAIVTRAPHYGPILIAYYAAFLKPEDVALLRRVVKQGGR